MARGKKYKKIVASFDKNKEYALEDAVELLPKVSTSAFSGSIDMHINLALTDKQKNESAKGSVQLPHQVGEPAKILVLAGAEHKKDAKDADHFGGVEMVKKIQDGWMDFDIVIATPDIMPKIAVLGKVLCPKGKMPNPKSGTVTANVKGAIANYKKGKIDLRMDKQAGIHQTIGKIDMTKEALLENINKFLKAVYKETKKFQVNPFKSIFVAPTMGPSIKLDTGAIEKELTL